MRKEFQDLMKTKSKSHNWPSTTQLMEFNQVTATEWFLHYWPRRHLIPGGPSASWFSCLVGRPGEVVACKSTSKLLLVLAVGKFAFVAWDLQPVPGVRWNNDFRQFQPVRGYALNFHWVTDFSDWLSVPVKPTLLAEHGPLILEQTEAAMDLPLRRIQTGLNLTCEQCRGLLTSLGVTFKKNQSRASLRNMLLDALLESDSEKERARQVMAAALIPPEQDDSSDYEDLIEHLEENENLGDPDLKREKKRLREKKLKAPEPWFETLVSLVCEALPTSSQSNNHNQAQPSTTNSCTVFCGLSEKPRGGSWESKGRSKEKKSSCWAKEAQESS